MEAQAEAMAGIYIHEYLYNRIFRAGRHFEGRPYLCKRYNSTWGNERAVEVPLVMEMVKVGRMPVLEVGNVLSHYFPFPHDVVDKYEAAPGVISEDITEFSTEKKYGLIVSISTFEHIGHDAPERRDPEKALKAWNVLKKCLFPDGRILMTAKLGHNLDFDEFIRKGAFGFSEERFLKRISKDNRYTWVSKDAAFASDLSQFKKGATVVLFGGYSQV